MDKVEIFNSFLSANKLNGKCIGMTKKGCTDVFDLKIENSFRLNKLNSLSRELMLALKSFSIPTVNFKLESGLLQIETLSENAPPVSLVERLSHALIDPNKLLLDLGTTFKGEPLTIELDRNPHMLIGGSTGSGKSSLLHTILTSALILTQADVHIVDTKGIEFTHYAELSDRVQITESFSDYCKLLKYLIHIMESRYDFLKSNKDLSVINNKYFKPIIVVIDEFADLIMQDDNKEGYTLLCKLVQKCRAAGIYFVLATQRPSADIITGVIKANFPARIACKVASKTDSRIILDHNGAEKLINIGEAVINNYKYELESFKSSYSSINEIKEFLHEKMASSTQMSICDSGNSWFI